MIAHVQVFMALKNLDNYKEEVDPRWGYLWLCPKKVKKVLFQRWCRAPVFVSIQNEEALEVLWSVQCSKQRSVLKSVHCYKADLGNQATFFGSHKIIALNLLWFN